MLDVFSTLAVLLPVLQIAVTGAAAAPTPEAAPAVVEAANLAPGVVQSARGAPNVREELNAMLARDGGGTTSGGCVIA